NETWQEAAEPVVARGGDVRRIGVGNAEEIQDEGQRVLEARVEGEELVRDLPPDHLRRVAVAEREVATQELAYREQGNCRGVRRAMGLLHGDPPRPAAIDELETDPALPDPGVADHAHDL